MYFVLLSVVHMPCFPDHMHFDLTGIIEVVLNFLGQFPRQKNHSVVVNTVGLDHDANLAAGLNGEGFFHPGKRTGHFFQFFKAFDIIFQILKLENPTVDFSPKNMTLKELLEKYKIDNRFKDMSNKELTNYRDNLIKNKTKEE